jgi:hypothetical protein
MSKTDLREKDDIFIVKVTGTRSRIINVPDAVCEFSNISSGVILKLKILEIKFDNKKKTFEKVDLRDKDDVFIVKVTGTRSKILNVPDAVCEFSNISSGVILKLKILEIKFDNKKNEK